MTSGHKNKLSVTIITKNEAENIGSCIESVDTVNICRELGCRVVKTEWLGFGLTKQFAVDSAKHDWILSLDADERVSPELRSAIQRILSNDTSIQGYKINRNSYYLNKLIHYSGWQNDRPLRLFDRRYGKFNDRIVHESVKTDGKTGMIREPILHYPYPDLNTHINKINRYSSLGAQKALELGQTASVPGAVLRGTFKFLKMYIFKLGYLDGVNGLLLALISSFGVSLKYFKLWKLNR